MQKLVERSMKQQEKLQHMLANLPSGVHEDVFDTPMVQNVSRYSLSLRSHISDVRRNDVLFLHFIPAFM